MWVYLLSTMAGGACAGLTYDKLFLEEIQVSRHTHTHTHRGGGWSSLDYLCIREGGGQTLEQYRAQMSMWAVLGAPLFIGVDVRVLSETYTCAPSRVRLAICLPTCMLSVSISKQLLLHEVSHAPLRVVCRVINHIIIHRLRACFCRCSHLIALVIFCCIAACRQRGPG